MLIISGGYWVRRMRQLPRAPLDFRGPPLNIPHIVSFCCICFLEIIMKLGRKVGNRRSIRREDLFFLEITMILGEKRDQIKVKTFFFRDHNDFGRKKRNTRSKPFFFLENIKFWKSLPRAPNFEYPPLLMINLKLNSKLIIVKNYLT